MIHPDQGSIATVLSPFRWLANGAFVQKLIVLALRTVNISAVCDATNNPPSLADADKIRVHIEGSPVEITVSEEGVLLRNGSDYISVALELVSRSIEVGDGEVTVSFSDGRFTASSLTVARMGNEERVNELQNVIDELKRSVGPMPKLNVISGEPETPLDHGDRSVLNLDISFDYSKLLK